jgi:catechol 2,3-dioxygenase-like lactoylglutathione lyase family enzyme
MIKSNIGHVVYNINPANVGFYRDLMTFLGWSPIFEQEGILRVADKKGASLWFMGMGKAVNNDYDGPGVNHLAFSVPMQSDVDAAVAYLTAAGVNPLFETPRHRPEFSRSAEDTYYQVMFESPDRILFEIVYTGPKAS